MKGIRWGAGAALAMAALAALAAGCKGSSGPPSTFGVNITVEASSLSAAERGRVVSGLLRVTGAESLVKTLDVHTAFSSGQLRFHYVPTVTTGAIDLAFDALDVSGSVVATGTAASSVTLVADQAGAATITLAMGSGKKGDGIACTGAADCDSGFCVDGVCCNEACDDTCASCALADSKGACTAYAVDTDPENECAAVIPPPPTTGDAGAADGGGADGGAGAGADGGGSDAPVINPPDGGVMTMLAACGGSCSGARSCKYPGAEKACGTPFCNDSDHIASFVCDGNGGCAVGLGACVDYACDPANATCRTRCSQPTDCGSGDYCSADGQCLPKKGISIGCTLSTECQSGFCASGVCCETACDQPGFSCNDPGSVGKCKCPGLTCTAGCRIFYRDMDGDGYGDKFATLAAASARTGCVEAPPSGFVADNTDCDDGDANARPGQTTYFSTSSLGNHTFDYDCNGTVEKQTSEFPGGSCRFCGAVGTCDQTTTTCAASSAQSAFRCPQELLLLRTLAAPSSAAAAPAATAATATADISIGGTIFLPQCCGCYASDQNGFTQTMNCGAFGTITRCGSCVLAGGLPVNSLIADYQRCR